MRGGSSSSSTVYEPCGRSCSRWRSVRSRAGSASCGAGGSVSPLWKHVRAPVGHAGPAGPPGAGGPHEREQRVAVAVEAQRLHVLHVAGRRPLVPLLLPRAAPQMKLAAISPAADRPLVVVGGGGHLPRG